MGVGQHAEQAIHGVLSTCIEAAFDPAPQYAARQAFHHAWGHIALADDPEQFRVAILAQGRLFKYPLW